MFEPCNPRLFAIADSDPMYRNEVTNRLCQHSERKSAFCAHNGAELLRNFLKNKVHVLIVDLFMPGISGFEAIEQIRQTDETVIIIACSTTFQPRLVPVLLDLKVNTYIPKDIRKVESLMNDIDMDVALEFDPAHFEHNNDHYLSSIHKKAVTGNQVALRPVQTQLTHLICEGKTNKEIAAIMYLSIRTIDTYVNQLLQQLELRNRQELISFAFKHNICHCICDIGQEGNCSVHSIFRPGN